MNSELIELKQKLFALEKEVELLKTAVPTKISLTDIARELNKSRQTIRAYVIKNFKEDFEYLVKNGKILIDVSVLPIIKAHYEK